jgi:hypothetical protein
MQCRRSRTSERWTGEELYRFGETPSAGGIEALQRLRKTGPRVLVTASDDSHARTSCESLR